MRRTWLAGTAVAAAAISIPVAALPGTAQAATAQAATASSQQTTAAAAAAAWNASAAALARRLVGDRYVSGGTSPAGFDCSGLTQWVYRHTGGGKSIARTSEAQYLQFKRISRGDARPGDLVFFHDTSSPGSYVYHVGVYEGGDEMMVAAATSAQGVVFQSFAWGGDTVTFGTITHA